MSVASGTPVITLLTDYGISDEFVGVLHGVIAKLCPNARVIDQAHGIAAQDVLGGAVILSQSLPYMPVGIHVAIVDPTVGGGRRAVALRLADGRTLVGPDNGLLWPAAQVGGGVAQAVDISKSRWRLDPVSATFHGRDIFAPVAARLAAGDPLDQAGEPLAPSLLVRLDMPRAWIEGDSLVAPVSHADHFGNVQLGAEGTDMVAIGAELRGAVKIRMPSGETHAAQYSLTFSDADEGKLILFEDSARKLALGINGGSALEELGLQAGDEVRITPAIES